MRANLSHLQLALPTWPLSPLEPAAGHAVPTRRVLSVRRVVIDEYPASGAARRVRISLPVPAPSRRAGPPTKSTPAFSAARIAARSARSGCKLCIDLMREMLQLPDTHRIGIVPGSDTGAFEMAMWTHARRAARHRLAWESFGEGWVTDAVKQLKLDAERHPRRLRRAPRPQPGRLVERRAVHLERHHLGRARARRRLDRRGPRGPELRRRDQRGVRLRHAVGQDRCRHLQLAEGARRRRRRMAC